MIENDSRISGFEVQWKVIGLYFPSTKISKLLDFI